MIHAYYLGAISLPLFLSFFHPEVFQQQLFSSLIKTESWKLKSSIWARKTFMAIFNEAV